MNCPKCNTKIEKNQTSCPKCKKVLFLECPNCNTLSESAICEKCGYTILVKCAKCSKMVPVAKESCKCGFPTSNSLAYQECETDEFASLIINFKALNKIKRILRSKELYTKFLYKLKNLLYTQINDIDCKFIAYDNIFVINLNKELSFTTSTDKAIRLALKIINAYVNLNTNILQELTTALDLSITIVKKSADKLQELTTYNSNVKTLSLKKDSKKYLKGFQIILDQYICDKIAKKYKTDSLYSIEQDGQTLTFYEIILDSYILPPDQNKDESIEPTHKYNKTLQNAQNTEEKDIYSFKVFDINAKCSFLRSNAAQITQTLANINHDKNGKIISIKSKKELLPSTQEIIDFYQNKSKKVIHIVCSEEMNYKPWGVFSAIIKEFFKLPFNNKAINFNNLSANSAKQIKPLLDLVVGRPMKAMSPEDARFGYMDILSRFLSILDNTTIIIEGAEYLDDTFLQTIEIYFDKYKNIKPYFVFIASEDKSIHSKIKSLLRTPLYTEISLQKASIDSCLSTLNSDASDFITSFYFEKIKENFNGSYLYFKNVIEYLKSTEVLIEFDNKLIIKNNKSVIVPKDIDSLYKQKVKNISKNTDISFILAYLGLLGYRLDKQTLVDLKINNIDENLKTLLNYNIIRIDNNFIYLNNFTSISPSINKSLKKEALSLLGKNILVHLGKGLDDSTLAIIMGNLGSYKEEYLTLWKNSQIAIKTGDYDSYLKNCLGFLSLVEHIESNITKEDIEENKKEVYNNILMFLYAYSPTKIYYIENMLLLDAINEGDDDKIIKLSNLMLQGALISSNYTDALGLLHNILSRMQNPTLIVDGAINTKFLLLSFVNIEICYNLGYFKQCIELADEILSVISYDVIEKIKPPSFSTNLFVSHILETLRLASLSRIFTLDKNLEEFFDKIKEKLNTELPEKDCIIAIKDFLSGKIYSVENIEKQSPYSKIIFLILQEFSKLENDYKSFAQNVYQAKLLASDIRNRELELFCDLLIAYAYSKIGINEKAESIYNDVIKTAEESAIFNILILSNYLFAKLKMETNPKESLLVINNMLGIIQKNNKQALILYALLEKLYIETATKEDLTIDIELESQKLTELHQDLALILK